MNIQRITFNGKGSKRSLLFLTVLVVLFPLRSGIGQTNLDQSGSIQTNSAPYRLPAPTDFQRLDYYYAAASNSPAPGTEHAIFTLRPDRIWSGDWNSSVVPRPSRAQLNAVTSMPVDLFRRAAVFTNGSWRITTSTTNIPLSSLNLTASSYALIRTTAQRDQILQRCQMFEHLRGATSATPTP